MGWSISATEKVIPPYSEFVKSHPPTETILVDQSGIILQTTRSEFSKRRIEWWEAEDFSPALIAAILAAEDKNFYQHEGVDSFALLSSLWTWVKSGNQRGGSTITMQVSSFLDSDLGGLGKKRTIPEKIKQIQYAGRLEDAWSKNQILSAYFNLVPMRGEWIGIPIAAYSLFSVSPKFLDQKQSLILAAMIRSPNSSIEKILTRAFLLSNALGWGYSRDELSELADSFDSNQLSSAWVKNYASHFAAEFYPESRGRFTTSLDWEIQNFAIETLKKNLESIREQNVRDGGILILDNSTGKPIVYVGGIPNLSSAEYVDSIQALRQAGSTLKPFLYGLALEKKYITSSSILLDSPLDIDVTRGMYRPSNYDQKFRGQVTAKEALGSSMNIPAVRTVLLTGVDSFHNILKEFGIQELRESDYYGYSLALGTADISLWNLTHAYSILARGGLDYKDQNILSSEVSFIISNILSDREARSSSFGLENHLSTRFWSAVKTGTSQDMRDNWCIGYNQKYTVGVWIGNFSGEPMRNITGITGAGPIWREMMEFLNERSPSPNPVPPPKLVSKYGYYYLEGTEPVSEPSIATLVEDEVAPTPKILYPPNGLIVAVDPDIPPSKQRILLRSNIQEQGIYWFLNGAKLGSATKDIPWSPKNGKYKLSIGRDKNRLIDIVKFEVR